MRGQADLISEAAPLPQSGELAAAMDIAIVTVQYNNLSDTTALLASLAAVEGAEDCELMVVDNSTLAAETLDRTTLSRLAPCPVHLLRPPANLYYWGGAEFALKSLYASANRTPAWVIICNNDVRIEDPLFLRRLRALDPSTHPIVAPRIVSLATGRDQNPLLRAHAGPLTLLKWRVYDLDYHVARTLLAIHGRMKRMVNPFTQRRRRKKTPPQPHQRIYAPHGAFMIFSAAFFERGGMLDTTVPMFAEELTIAALAERLNLPVWYCPELHVLHREHSTTGTRLTRAKYDMERFARRHYFGLAKH